ncbi:hypothetical protein RUM43_010998 [Polyplax serrata]|uniref:Coiled-coil domain-containing protein 151 n=1 Tax=Polyplax serrata TaxID=468196 RepID=A0AAN8RT90_POLSC
MPLQKDDNMEDSLAEVNHKITEIKKKIQLSEGQRKAHFEECDAEKKRNIERIRSLKKEVKEIYKKLAEPMNCDESILKSSSRYPKDAGALRNKKLEEAIVFVDLKCIDLNKQLDVFKYKNKLKKARLKKLAEECRDMVSKTSEKKGRKIETVSNKPMCVLENQIHRVEMNMMEAEHVNKKYKTIRLHLLSDSVQFESSLKKLEDEIEKQNVEIKNLQVISKEALGLRDITKGTLMHQELSALNAGKNRENQLQDFRHRVDERKVELERLERRIFPAGRMVFDEGIEGGDGGQAGENANQIVSNLEAAFTKLKVATGETETEDILPRFVSQKETKQRLDFLKRITEEEKKQLEMKKEAALVQLEATKFSEVKDREQSQEEIDKLKKEIEEETSKKETYVKELERIKKQLLDIRNCLYSVIRELQHANDEVPPEPSEKVETYSTVLNCLVRKIKSGLSQIGMGDTLREVLKNMQEQQQNKEGISVAIPSEETPLFPGLLQQGECKQPKVQQTSLLPQDSDDEEDIPSRTYLKRQAQLLVDAKSRKKFNRVLNFSKGKK